MELYQQREYWPTSDWKQISPQDAGLKQSLLESMQEYITTHLPGLHGLLMVRHGYLAFEAYYQGFQRQSYNNIASATKSVVSALLGTLLMGGQLKNVEQHMLEFFPEFAVREPDPRKQAITIRHLLNLTGGFSHDFPHEYWLNPVQLAVERTMIQSPGEAFYYDSQGVDILAGIITRITGKSAAAFADETLFQTLGIWKGRSARFAWHSDSQVIHSWHADALWDEKDGYPWKIDPQGYSTGGFGLHLTAREMAKIGYLYLNQGHWNGEPLLPESFVMESTRPQSTGGPPLNLPYGYLWWLTDHDQYTTFFASGYAGRLIYVIPELDLVIVTTASTDQAMRTPEQTLEIRALISRFIIPALSH